MADCKKKKNVCVTATQMNLLPEIGIVKKNFDWKWFQISDRPNEVNRRADVG